MSHNYFSNANAKAMIIIVEWQGIPRRTLESLERGII